MRVLLATDGSRSAQAAVDLVAGIAWPEGTSVRVLQVLPPLSIVELRPGQREALDVAARNELHQLAEPLRHAGLVVDELLPRGATVADLIVAEARASNAQLIVIGNRGHGPLGSMLLGSVAAAVTDSAPCPVLVARGSRLGQILFAEDGSDSAFEARRLLATWPIFRGLPVRVLSVAHVTRPFRSGITAAVFEEARRAEAELLTEARHAHEHLANETAEQLRVGGLHAEAEVREGDAAEEIVAAAERRSADLIVMGSRGRSGVTRAVLGSAARYVLQHARCSVLIARQGIELPSESDAGMAAAAR